MILFLLKYIPRLLLIKYNAIIKKKTWFVKLIGKDRSVILKHKQPGFWADPFIVRENNLTHIFFENYLNSLGRGIVSHVSVDENFQVSEPTDLITEDFHLSFPGIIKSGPDFYMIPESKNANEIRLYECISFPLQWQLKKALIKDIRAVDPSVIFYKGLYWLFCTVQTGELSNSSDALFIYYSDQLLNEWTPHAENPVKLDHNSRSAGDLYVNDGILYRPVQNSTFGYGSGINIYEIKELTPTTYNDTLITSMRPDAFDKTASGLHTINKTGEYTVIDLIKNI